MFYYQIEEYKNPKPETFIGLKRLLKFLTILLDSIHMDLNSNMYDDENLDEF